MLRLSNNLGSVEPSIHIPVTYHVHFMGSLFIALHTPDLTKVPFWSPLCDIRALWHSETYLTICLLPYRFRAFVMRCCRILLCNGASVVFREYHN